MEGRERRDSRSMSRRNPEVLVTDMAELSLTPPVSKRSKTVLCDSQRKSPLGDRDKEMMSHPTP